MPTGVYYGICFKYLIFKNHLEYGYDAQWILTHCFSPNNLTDDREISLEYLKVLCRKLEDPADSNE